MFEDGGSESKQPCPSVECKCGTSMAAVYSGTILISVGALLFCVVLLVPICRASNRKGEYRKAPTEETPVRKEMSSESLSSQPSDFDRRTSSGAASSTSSLQKIPVLAVVHNVQPKAQHRSTSNLHEYRKNANQFKDSFEEED
ncbi:hypothetical protein AC249_AIPGENE19155 [Exaiptasia diaphana]|nr:hypothetical protein AC249_AIPGENE19155 [Exaiptasia diaphana]